MSSKKIENYIIIGRIYEFDCEFFTASRRRTEMIGGTVREIINEGEDTFIILDDNRAISSKNITRILGPYED